VGVFHRKEGKHLNKKMAWGIARAMGGGQVASLRGRLSENETFSSEGWKFMVK